MNRHIIIKRNDDCTYDVHVDNKYADSLGSDETIGLLSALINTDRTLQWLKTPEQHLAYNKRFKNNNNG